jgi:hypothetical protein
MNREHKQDAAPVATTTHRRTRAERRVRPDAFGGDARASLPIVPEPVDSIARFDALALDALPESRTRSEPPPAVYRLTYACSAAGTDPAA